MEAWHLRPAVTIYPVSVLKVEVQVDFDTFRRFGGFTVLHNGIPSVAKLEDLYGTEEAAQRSLAKKESQLMEGTPVCG